MLQPYLVSRYEVAYTNTRIQIRIYNKSRSKLCRNELKIIITTMRYNKLAKYQMKNVIALLNLT